MGNRSSKAIVADFNGDGIPDLAIPNDNGLNVLLGNRDGTFQRPIISKTEPFPINAAVGDFDSDGIPDVAVIGDFKGVDILLGKGDGTFQPYQTTPYGSVAAFYLPVSDFNNDGIADTMADAGTDSRTAAMQIYLGKMTALLKRRANSWRTCPMASQSAISTTME